MIVDFLPIFFFYLFKENKIKHINNKLKVYPNTIENNGYKFSINIVTIINITLTN